MFAARTIDACMDCWSVLFIIVLEDNLCSFEFDIIVSLARLYKFSYEIRKSGKLISISINIKQAQQCLVATHASELWCSGSARKSIHMVLRYHRSYELQWVKPVR